MKNVLLCLFTLSLLATPAMARQNVRLDCEEAIDKVESRLRRMHHTAFFLKILNIRMEDLSKYSKQDLARLRQVYMRSIKDLLRFQQDLCGKLKNFPDNLVETTNQFLQKYVDLSVLEQSDLLSLEKEEL